jgi:alkylation response protein AidB-like acyl-CoA dehydrogenase
VALRMARVCLEECFTFAQRRMTFGKTLAEHDVIKMMLAQMACRVEQQQAWLESVVFQMQHMSKSEASELGATICGLKAQSGEVLEECARLTTHVFGGNALDAASVGRRIQHMADSQKGYVIPAGATRIMEMQMTKLAIKQAERVAML